MNIRTLACSIRCVLLASLSAGGAYAAEIEEIIVTAQKRSESAQDIGLAINAFSAEDLRNLGAGALRDVTNFTPNVQLFDEYGTGQPTWVIRGVGLSDWSANNTPTAAIYVDDVYMTSNVMGGGALFDLDRVEVLKGPQGALYGRNTSGGAVRVISRRPSTEGMDGEVALSYGRWNDAIVEGALNVPLGEDIAWRVAGRWNQSGDRWQESLVDGEEHGEKDLWSVRSSLLVQPSDATEILISMHASADKSETVMGRGIGVYDPATGGFCAPLLEGRLDDSACAMNATFYDPLFRFPDLQDDDGHTTFSDPINQLDNDARGAVLHISHDFGALRLVSVSGYESFDFALAFDYDGSSGEFGHQFAESDIEAWSQELRLESQGDGDVTWLLGLEIARDELEEDRDVLVGDDALLVGLLGEAAQLTYDQKTESKAAYGQLDWQFAEQWKLGIGVRYTDESKDYDDGEFLLVFGGSPFPFQAGLNSELDMQVWSGKISLEWTPADDVLLYLSASRGFKSGGFFGGFPIDGQENVRPYEEETVYAWEAGFKTQWLDDSLRLNGALFLYDYRDVQGYVTVFSDVSQSVVTRLDNIGDAEHKGGELELLWRPTERLLLQASMSWLDATIDDSDAVSTSWLGTLEPLEGLDRPFAPELGYTLLGRYEVPLDTLTLAFQADYNWRDDRDGGRLSVIEQTMYAQLDDYGLLGARVSIASNESTWEVALWGRNLADEEYWANVTTDDLASWMALPGEPRSYGIDLRYRF